MGKRSVLREELVLCRPWVACSILSLAFRCLFRILHIWSLFFTRRYVGDMVCPPARRADAREPMPPSIPDTAQEVYERSDDGTRVFLVSSTTQHGAAVQSCLSTRSTTVSTDPWTARDNTVPSSNRSPSIPKMTMRGGSRFIARASSTASPTLNACVE